MAYWTILGKANTEPARTFGVTLDTSGKTWIANGPGVNDVFRTKSGTYIVKPAPELATYLMKAGSNEPVAVLRNLHGASTVGAAGEGRQHETAVNFGWRLQSV
jgi:hypothetical protein